MITAGVNTMSTGFWTVLTLILSGLALWLVTHWRKAMREQEQFWKDMDD
jgi:hypothetical protein